jgi:hypothetical protein
VEEARAIERARRDIARGELWRARDRLGSYVAQHPSDQVALDLLGDVLWRMGDAPMAGRCWYLTERDDDRARQARAAFERRFPIPERRRALRAGEPFERYPTAARERLDALPRSEAADEEHAAGSAFGTSLFVLVVLVLTVGVWLLGAATAVVLLVRAVT